MYTSKNPNITEKYSGILLGKIKTAVIRRAGIPQVISGIIAWTMKTFASCVWTFIIILCVDVLLYFLTYE